MKKIFPAALVLALLILFSSCRFQESHPSMDIRVEDGKTVYDGCEQYFYTVPEGLEGVLTVSLRRESGSFSLKVFPTADRKRVTFQGKKLGTSEFTVELTEPGEYKVWVDADDFVGSYTFGYEEVKKE